MNATQKRHTLRQLLTLLAGLTALALTVFHLLLLWRRLLDTSIAQPGVLIRWIAAALLTAGLFAARGHGRNRFLVIGLLIALLHAGIPAGAHPAVPPLPLGVVVQIGFAVICGTLLTALIASLVRKPSTPARLELDEFFIVSPIAGASFFGRSPPLN